MSESKGNGFEKCLCERCYMFKTLLIKYWDKELNQTKKKKIKLDPELMTIHIV